MRFVLVLSALRSICACGEWELTIEVSNDLAPQKQEIQQEVESLLEWFAAYKDMDYGDFSGRLYIYIQAEPLEDHGMCKVGSSDTWEVTDQCHVTGRFTAPRIIELTWGEGTGTNSLVHELLHYYLYSFYNPRESFSWDYLDSPMTHGPANINHTVRFLDEVEEIQAAWAEFNQ